MILLSGFSLGVITLIIVILARDFGRLPVAQAFIAMAIAAACYLLKPFVDQPWKMITADFYTMVPSIFWLVCRLAFTEKPRLISPLGAIAIYTFMAQAISRHVGVNSENLTEWRLIGRLIPSYCEYFMVAMGMWTVLSNWEDDLVESRRKLRGVVLAVVGVGVFMVIIPSNTGIARSWLPYLSYSVITLFCGLSLLRGRTGVLFGIQNASGQEPNHVANENIEASADAPEEIKKDDVQALEQLMAEGFYRTERLTLKMLAEKLKLPEYKTRALINQTLGYRNFNDYINQLRINEAAQRLLNEEQTPILNISLDVGYRSLSSFNRAFKDIQEMTPTEYRLHSN